MKTKEQIKEWLLQNCVDSDGRIDISGLDFSDFNGDILRGEWKVKRNLLQSWNEVQGDLWQDCNEVQGDLWQGHNETQGDLFQNLNEVQGTLLQNNNKVKGDLSQNSNNVQGHLFQERNEVNGNLWQTKNKVNGETYNDFKHHNQVLKYDEEQGWVEDKRFVKPLEDMTKEQLIQKIREMEK